MPRPATATLEEVAAELQISMSTCRRRVKDKSIPAFKMGVFWRVRRAWLDELRGSPAPAPEEHFRTITPRPTHDEPHAEKAPVPARHAYPN